MDPDINALPQRLGEGSCSGIDNEKTSLTTIIAKRHTFLQCLNHPYSRGSHQPQCVLGGGVNSVSPSATAVSRILGPGRVARLAFHPGPFSGSSLQSCVLSPGRPCPENLTSASVCHPNPACGRVSRDLAPNFRNDPVNPRSVNAPIRSIFAISCSSAVLADI